MGKTDDNPRQLEPIVTEPRTAEYATEPSVTEPTPENHDRFEKLVKLVEGIRSDNIMLIGTNVAYACVVTTCDTILQYAEALKRR